MDLREVLRHLQVTSNLSAIRRATGLNRRTLFRYRAWAQAQGLLGAGAASSEPPLPPLESLQQLAATTLRTPAPPQTVSSVEPYRELVLHLHAQGVEGTAMLQRLRERGYAGTLSSRYRFLHRLDSLDPARRRGSRAAVVRIEREPGSEAQVDFGYAGRLIDPQTGALRKAWAFVMLLAYSRHQYVEFVFDQQLETWIALHRHAFAFFGGVPCRVVLDNLKAGVTRACFDDPQIQPTYRECAEHYGFLLAPCAPRTPRAQRESGAGRRPLRQAQLPGGPAADDRDPGQRRRAGWCRMTAGQRLHGTTKVPPLQRFEQTERAQLRPLPPTPYDLAQWKRVTLHRDGYVVFEQAFYSAPFRRIGRRFGSAAAVSRCGSTPPTTRWWPPIRGPGDQASASPIPTTCPPRRSPAPVDARNLPCAGRRSRHGDDPVRADAL